MVEATAAAYADERVSRVRDLPDGRLDLLRDLYRLPPGIDRGICLTGGRPRRSCDGSCGGGC